MFKKLITLLLIISLLVSSCLNVFCVDHTDPRGCTKITEKIEHVDHTDPRT